MSVSSMVNDCMEVIERCDDKIAVLHELANEIIDERIGDDTNFLSSSSIESIQQSIMEALHTAYIEVRKNAIVMAKNELNTL